MRITSRVGFVALVLLLGAPAIAADWRVGIARTEITPAGLVWMGGYAGRDHPAEGTLHPLWAKAMALEDQRGSRAVIVTVDLIGLNREVCEGVARRVQSLVGIPRERLLFNSSHTHSGPVVSTLTEVAYRLDAQQRADVDAYARTLEEKLVQVIRDACTELRPATLAYGEGSATFAANRRVPKGKSDVKAPPPAGPVDHTVPVLAVRDLEGRLVAALFGYACHNTTLAIYQYNGDYAGFAQIALEKAHPGSMAMFMSGCGADVNPQPRREVVLAEQHGKELSAAVDEVLRGKLQPVRGPLAVAFARIDLPFVDPPSKEELERRAEGKNVYQQRLAKLLLEQMAQGRALPTSYPCPLQVLRCGNDFTLIGMSGEVVVDYMLRLRREFPGKRLWTASYCNEVFAYVPSERVLAEGGYEGGDAMVYFGWYGPFKPGLENRLVDKIKELVAQCEREIACAGKAAVWREIAPFFTPPAEFAHAEDRLRSPLKFDSGEPVKTPADWQRRRQEILSQWHGMMGPWPPVIEKPRVEILGTQRRENFVQQRIRFEWLPNEMTEGYLLIPEGEAVRPAVLVVFYEPETAIGQGKEYRDFAYQLTKRGFVTLSIGNRAGLDSKTYAVYYPSKEKAALQPLSALAYVAANAYHVLAGRKEVDPRRIGVMGHSFGGKWAMFASCLYDKFACAVWSDPGIVFDESRPSVNYWEPWYLGYEPGRWRTRGIITDANPRIGLYKKLVAEGRDLHELHALMAPRPFLVSGGSEDQPQRWRALGHTIEVNTLLGFSNRVAMTNRPEHSPNAESNEQIYRFFQYFLEPNAD